MELDYEKDLLKLMKLLAYCLQSIKYQNPQFGENPQDFFGGQPWIDIDLNTKELEEIGITPTRARLLRAGVCAKQGMNPNDFLEDTKFPSEEKDGEAIYLENLYGKNVVSIPTLFWIESIIHDIENNIKETSKIKTLKKVFDENNFIELNIINGDFIYNKVTGHLGVKSRPFKFLKALLQNDNNSVTYDELAVLLFDKAEEYSSASHREGLFEALGTLKESFGILPIRNRKNLDCFENENKSYRLVNPI